MCAQSLVDESAIPVLEACALECIRGDRVLFSDLNFTLPPATALRVEGPNGAGKTSLLRILCGLSLPAEGVVRWRGQDISRTRIEFLNEVAYVGHTHGVKGDLNPLENLDVARSLGGTAKPMAAADALARLGLEGYEEVPCRMLSAGQRRRVALARLLVVDARLWILDEPFTALDVSGVETVEGLIDKHLTVGGMAVFTSHQPVALGSNAVEHIGLYPYE